MARSFPNMAHTLPNMAPSLPNMARSFPNMAHALPIWLQTVGSPQKRSAALIWHAPSLIWCVHLPNMAGAPPSPPSSASSHAPATASSRSRAARLDPRVTPCDPM
eukprot:6807043-Prymnesium_polylepis.4